MSSASSSGAAPDSPTFGDSARGASPHGGLGSPGLRPFALIVLAGGKSRRMGSDKAALVLEEQTLLERTVEQGTQAGAGHVLIIGGDPGWVGRFVEDSNVHLVADRWPGGGPLGAVATGIAEANRVGGFGPRVVLSCDLPFINAHSISWLVNRWFDSNDRDHHPEPWAVVPNVDGRDQPLFAAYAPTCEVVADELFRSGTRNLGALVAALEVVRDSADELAPVLVDVDTPEDWERARSKWVSDPLKNGPVRRRVLLPERDDYPAGDE